MVDGRLGEQQPGPPALALSLRGEQVSDGAHEGAELGAREGAERRACVH